MGNYKKNKLDKDFKDEQKANKKLILVTLLVFHFEISGKDTKDEHLKNKILISVTLLVFQFKLLDKDSKE